MCDWCKHPTINSVESNTDDELKREVIADLNRWVRGIAHLRTRHFKHVDHNDVSQNMCEAMLKAWTRYRGQCYRVPYLIQTAKYELLDNLVPHSKQEAREDVTEHAELALMPVMVDAEDAQHLERIDTIKAVREAIPHLTVRQQEYVYLRFWVGLKKSELNKAMGIARAHSLWSGPSGIKKALLSRVARDA